MLLLPFARSTKQSYTDSTHTRQRRPAGSMFYVECWCIVAGSFTTNIVIHTSSSISRYCIIVKMLMSKTHVFAGSRWRWKVHPGRHHMMLMVMHVLVHLCVKSERRTGRRRKQSAILQESGVELLLEPRHKFRVTYNTQQELKWWEFIGTVRDLYVELYSILECLSIYCQAKGYDGLWHTQQ